MAAHRNVRARVGRERLRRSAQRGLSIALSTCGSLAFVGMIGGTGPTWTASLGSPLATLAPGARPAPVGTSSAGAPAPGAQRPGAPGSAAFAAGTVAPSSPPRVPRSGAYLGAVPNFRDGASESTQAIELEHRTGRVLGIVSYYVAWGEIPPLSDIDRIADRGSIPMINMKCGASDSDVAAGKWDRRLREVARSLEAYGGPVLFRWFWEMNLVHVDGHARCLGSRAQGARYIAAFRHIREVFNRAGARNVAFVWCPSGARSARHKNDSTYYPGNGFVDWIGLDLYDRPQVTVGFAQQFGDFYRHWSSASGHKPIILCETGAVGSGPQRSWLDQIHSALTTRVKGAPDTPFSGVHAVVYVDATDIYDYVLVRGSAGFREYRALAHERYFSVTPRP